MNDESPQLAAARAGVESAIREFVKVRVSEYDVPITDSYVTGWAAFAEFTTSEYERNDLSGNVVVVPDAQTGATTRGLFEFGADGFSRRM